jgi:hypothetical protein
LSGSSKEPTLLSIDNLFNYREDLTEVNLRGNNYKNPGIKGRGPEGKGGPAKPSKSTYARYSKTN